VSSEVRLCGDLTDAYAVTGSALLAGDIDTTRAETIVSAVKRLPQAVDPEVRARAEKHLLEEAQPARRRPAPRRRTPAAGGHRPDAAEAKAARSASAGYEPRGPNQFPTMPTDGQPMTVLEFGSACPFDPRFGVIEQHESMSRSAERACARGFRLERDEGHRHQPRPGHM
jgi:hypothetical protein